MKSLLILSFVCYISCFSWKDCGPADAIWRYTGVDFKPIPILYPNPCDVNLVADISADVPADNLQLQISIDKLSPDRMHIPCLNNFGSCNFDYCSFEKSEQKSTDLYGAFANIPCNVKKGKYNINLAGRTFPILQDPFRKILEGSFELNATYVDKTSGKVYGCINANFDVKLKPEY